MSRDIRLSRYLVAILDLCKLGGFPAGVQFQLFQAHLYEHIGEEIVW